MKVIDELLYVRAVEQRGFSLMSCGNSGNFPETKLCALPLALLRKGRRLSARHLIVFGSNVTEVALKGITQYIKEVKEGSFPDDDHSYGVDDKEYEKFVNLVEKRKQH